VKALQCADNLKIIPNLTLKNSAGQTALGVAIWGGHREVAEQLIAGGANVNDVDSEDRSLLQQAILKHDVDGALFLLENQADYTVRCQKEDCFATFICFLYICFMYIYI